jgi:hypothetical protein
VFVPETHADEVLSAADSAGAARIGSYSRCSFRSMGTGSFRGDAGSAPFSGAPGREERVEEVRLETVAAGALVPLEAGADLFVTGDVKYHQALEAESAGIPVADIGHASGERWILPEFRRVLLERFRGAVTVRVMYETEPLRLIAAGRSRGGKRP